MPEEQTERSLQLDKGVERKALSTPDAQDSRNADAGLLRAAQELNQDKHDGSAGGDKKDSIMIESDGEVIASREHPKTEKEIVELKPQDSITLAELKELASKQTGYPWAQSLVKKFEAAQKLPAGDEKNDALAKAQDMADLMARRGQYVLEGKIAAPLPATSNHIEQPPQDAKYKPNDSYVLALSTAVANAKSPEEAEKIQAQVSIDYMTQKGQEALAAIQKSAADQVLLASSITPAAPNVQSGELVDLESDATNAKAHDGDVLAGKPIEAYYLEHPEAAPIQLPKVNAKEMFDSTIQGTVTVLDQALKAVKLSDDATFKNLDYPTCKAAIERFPELKAYGVSEKVIAAIILNELVHRDADDDAEDKKIREDGKIMNDDGSESITASIGPAQMQVQNVHRLAGKYPEMKLFQSDPVRAALEPSIAPYFVAAYLQEQVDAFKQYDKAHPAEPTPKCFEALLYTYNPDVVSKSSIPRSNIKPEDYREISASEKLEAKVTGHRADSLKNWTSESYPRNQAILQTSGVVKTIKQVMQAIETRFGGS